MPPIINYERCIGCEICDKRCLTDVFYTVPRAEAVEVLGRRVIKEVFVKYPDECWHCGVCRLDCPTDAIHYEFPSGMLQMQWQPESLHIPDFDEQG